MTRRTPPPWNSFRRHWYSRRQLCTREVPARVMHWLFDKDSLTARLIDLCGSGFHVDLIEQSVRKPRLDELRIMKMRAGRNAVVREVRLCCGDTPWVYARTVIPRSTLTGSRRVYAKLGNRPLGAMLFADRTMKRGPVEVSCIPSSQLPIDIGSDEMIWGRRSVFHVGGKPLLVSEYFLPELVRRY